MRFFIYGRKSVLTGVGESVDNQIEMCRSYIHSKFGAGHEITVFEDEGYSARDTNRPQFIKMMESVYKTKPDYIVCYRLDRISRSVSDFSKLIEELNRLSVSFLCISEEFDTKKPMGKAMMYIASVFSQLERETIAERVRDNMLLLAKNGRWLGGTPPYGYTAERGEYRSQSGNTRKFSYLKMEEKEAKTVAFIFSQYLKCGSVSAVEKQLLEGKIINRNAVPFSRLGIKGILQNPVYSAAEICTAEYLKCDIPEDKSVGLIAYNKRTKMPGGWVVSRGFHKPIVSGADWVAAQKLLNRSCAKTRKPHNGYSLLSGIIVCPVCGGKMFAKRRTGKTANTNEFDYICSNKLKFGKKFCTSHNLNGNMTDSAVWSAVVSSLVASADILKKIGSLKKKPYFEAKEEFEIKRGLIKECVGKITVDDNTTNIFLK